MKNKLIAIVLTTSIIGGVGSTAYAAGIGSNDTSNVVVRKCSYKKRHDRLFKKRHPFYNGGCTNRPNNGTENGDIDEIIPPIIGDKPSKDEVIPPTTEDKPSIDEVIPPTTGDESSKDDVIPPTTGDESSKDDVTPPTTDNTPSVNDKFMAQVEQKIFEKVNEERAKAGVSTLSYNSTMEKYARIKSQDMGDRGYFDHVDPEGNLITVKMQQDGVRYNAWGENIAYIGGVSDADALATQFMKNWMNSQGHRENILSTNFASVGVGVYKSGNRVYATQEFYR